MRLLMAGALLAVCVAPLTPAAADPRQDVSVVVRANAGDTTTFLPTVSGKSYRVTVRGTYSHDGTQLADCGHVNAGDVGAVNYVPVTNLYVNGAAAPCSSQPFEPTFRTYHWNVTGTGQSLRFRLVAPATATGALVVSVSWNTVTAECHYSVSGIPNSVNVLVSIQALATADGASDAATTSLRCAVSNSYGEEVVAQTVVPGPRAVIVAEGILRSSTLVPCLEASSTWSGLPTLSVGTVSYVDC